MKKIFFVLLLCGALFQAGLYIFYFLINKGFTINSLAYGLGSVSLLFSLFALTQGENNFKYQDEIIKLRRRVFDLECKLTK